MVLYKLDDDLGISQVLALAADDVFNDTTELGFDTFLLTVFTPDADDEGIFCH